MGFQRCAERVFVMYTHQHDIHDVGIVLAQMLMGLDVVTRV